MTVFDGLGHVRVNGCLFDLATAPQQQHEGGNMLFEPRERTDNDFKSPAEGTWNYLDRSARSEADRVRTFLNRWMEQYPAGDRAELIARFRSTDRHNYQSGFFELVLFAPLTLNEALFDLLSSNVSMSSTGPKYVSMYGETVDMS